MNTFAQQFKKSLRKMKPPEGAPSAPETYVTSSVKHREARNRGLVDADNWCGWLQAYVLPETDFKPMCYRRKDE